MARSLGRVPCELTAAERDELIDVYGERNAEWVVLGAVMMGFLNKFMDSIGVELEQSVVSEVSSTMGTDWSPGKAGTLLDPASPARPLPPVDGLRTRMRLLPLLPAAIRFDRRWQRETPSRRADVAAFLSERTGHDFPVLDRLHSSRARRSIASMLQQNLDPESSVVGSISRCWSERSSPRSRATDGWLKTSVPWPVTPALAARRSETPSRTPAATTPHRPPAPPPRRRPWLSLAPRPTVPPESTPPPSRPAGRADCRLGRLHRLTCYVTVGD